MTDWLAEDFKYTSALLRKYALGPAQDTALFRAVCSNNLNIILAALDIAQAASADFEKDSAA